MALVSLAVEPLRLALRAPLRTAGGSYRLREGLAIRIRDDGRVGRGEAMPLPGFGTESLDAAAVAVRGAWTHLDGRPLPDGPVAVDGWLDRLPELRGCPAARNALESALLDLLGQASGVPIARLLDAHAADSFEVNALLTAPAADRLGEEARTAIEQGFRHLKLKVGVDSIDRDVARVFAVRDSAGPSVALRVDANGAWGPKAAENLRRLAAARLELCEQPVAAPDVAGLRALRALAICPIAADESAATPYAAAQILSAEPAADLLALRPMALGGILPSLRLARLALEKGVGCYVVSSLDGTVARAASAQLAAALPGPRHACGLGVGALFEGPEDALYRPVHGRIQIPAEPGLGLRELRS